MYFNFTHFLKQLPFFRLVVPFMLGIIFQILFISEINIYPYLIVLFIILIILNSIKHSITAFKTVYISGIIINFILFLAGASVLSLNTKETFKHTGNEIIAEGVIKEPAEETSKSFKSVLNLNNYSVKGQYFSSDEDIIIYLEKSENSGSLEYGDKIIFKSFINEIRTSGNPNEFDYQRFLLRKGIIGQSLIKDNNWKLQSKNKGLLIFRFAHKARKTLADIYRKFNIEGQESAVLQALTLGDKSELNTETKQAYASSGAMHILAVSGLHVGILYFLLNYFLSFIGKIKYRNINYGKWLKALIIILLLWAFALLSGLSPSVRRAAIMFSFIILGQAMNRRISIYNSLAASAFIILLFDPYQISSVGFQLSYSAVIAIVFFQPKIVNLFSFNNKILYYLWSLTAVSISAQIGTFPFSLYYFNTFPNLFFITNIFVIPLASIIIYAAVFLLIFSSIPVVSNIFAFILKYLVKMLNFSVEIIEKIPFSHTENISFSINEIVLAYTLIISISFFLIYKNARSLQICLGLIILWISLNSINKICVNIRPELIVYNIKNESAVNILGKENYLLCDSTILNDQKIKYGPMNRWLSKGKTNYELIEISLKSFDKGIIKKRENYIIFYNKLLLILNDHKQIQYHSTNKMHIDFLVLSKNVNVKISEIKDLYNPNLIVFDSSNNFYKIKNWKKECNELNQDFYSVIDEGAFITDL